MYNSFMRLSLKNVERSMRKTRGSLDNKSTTLKPKASCSLHKSCWTFSATKLKGVSRASMKVENAHRNIKCHLYLLEKLKYKEERG